MNHFATPDFWYRYRHLANVVMRPVIETVCKAKGFEPPIICTPEDLLESNP